MHFFLTLTSFVLMLAALVAVNSGCFHDSVLYSQKVIRDDNVFADRRVAKRGTLTLTSDGIVFNTDRPDQSRFNFSIKYAEIRMIRRHILFLFQNRIQIKTKTGESYRLFTFKRGKILAVAKRQITVLNKRLLLISQNACAKTV